MYSFPKPQEAVRCLSGGGFSTNLEFLGLLGLLLIAEFRTGEEIGEDLLAADMGVVVPASW